MHVNEQLILTHLRADKMDAPASEDVAERRSVEGHASSCPVWEKRRPGTTEKAQGCLAETAPFLIFPIFSTSRSNCKTPLFASIQSAPI